MGDAYPNTAVRGGEKRNRLSPEFAHTYHIGDTPDPQAQRSAHRHAPSYQLVPLCPALWRVASYCRCVS